MAKEDFCFTYYDGDAAKDKSHMDRLERGAYDDLVSLQRKVGHFTLDQAKKVLSKDFELCWPAQEMILKIDIDGRYFIDWLDMSISKMRAHSQKQTNKAKRRWDMPEASRGNATALPNTYHGISGAMPLEDGDGYSIEDVFISFCQTFSLLVQTLPVSATENAHVFHRSILEELKQKGFNTATEYEVPEGRIDIAVFLDGVNVAIELDNRMPRGKSLLKMNNTGFRSISVLRNPRIDFDYSSFQKSIDYLVLYHQPQEKTVPIVPAMVSEFKIRNLNYPEDPTIDYPAANELAQKISKWDKLPGNYLASENYGNIIRRWGDILDFVSKHSHFSTYSISQLNKHFQSVTQSINNGKSSFTNRSSNKSSGAEELAERLRADFNGG